MQANPTSATNRLFHAYLLIFLVVGGAILALSGKFGPGFLSHPFDKMAHFAGIGLFTFVLGGFIRSYWIAAIIGMTGGAAAELAQLFVPSRVFSINDMVANAAGALTVLLVWLAYQAIMRSAHKSRTAPPAPAAMA